MFLLLKLPLLCIREILKKINPRDLIHFSLASKNSYRLLKLMRTRVNVLTLNQREGKIMFDDFNEEEWCINVGDFKEKATITTNMNGAEVRTYMTDTNSYSYTDQNVFEFLKYAIQYLTEIFNCYVDHCWFDIDRMENMNKIFEFGITRCYHLRLDGERLVGDEEMLSIIKAFTVQKYSFYLNLSDTFYCDPDLIKTRYLYCSKTCGKWVTGETFLRLQRIPTIWFCTPKQNSLTADDFIAFISQWYHSDNTQFKTLTIRAEWEIPDGSLTQFNPRQYNPKKRGPAFRFSNTKAISSVGGTDILRSDDILATVIYRPKYNFFHVWHERFPNVSDVRVI